MQLSGQDADRPADTPALLLAIGGDAWADALAGSLDGLTGLSLVRAGDLADGLAAALQEVAVVVLALDLPDSRGLATLDAIRAALPDAPVIVLAAEDDPAMDSLVIRRGAADVVATPGLDAADAARRVRQAVLHVRARAMQRARAPGSTGAIVHDFNNLLQIIINASEELSEAGLPQPLAQSVEAIRAAARRGIALTRQLQDAGATHDNPTGTTQD